MPNKTVIYSAVFGKRDWRPVVRDLGKGVDLVVFTPEQDVIRAVNKDKSPWRAVEVERTALHGAKAARWFKTQPHECLKEYDVSLWVDANICITQNPVPIISRELGSGYAAFYEHWSNVKGPFDEINRCLSMKKGLPAELIEQRDRYTEIGLPRDLPMVAGGIIIRRHNDPACILFDNLWWEEILRGSSRDQISWACAAYHTNLSWNAIQTPRNDWIKLGTHMRRDSNQLGDV